MIIMMMIVTTTLMITIPITIRITIPILIVISQCLLVRRRGSGVVGLGHEASSRILIYREKKRNRVRERCVSYIYIYIYIYTHTYIHTYKHATMPGSQYPLFSCRSFFPSHCAEGSLSAGAHTSGSYVALLLAWTLGDIKISKCACSAGPEPGSLSTRVLS